MRIRLVIFISMMISLLPIDGNSDERLPVRAERPSPIRFTRIEPVFGSLKEVGHPYAPGHGGLRGYLACGAKFDVAWGLHSIYLVRKPGLFERIYARSGHYLREKDICFDGRYIWVAEPSRSRMTVINPRTLDVHFVDEPHGFPAGRVAAVFPLQPGRVLVCGLSYEMVRLEENQSRRRVKGSGVNWYAKVTYHADQEYDFELYDAAWKPTTAAKIVAASKTSRDENQMFSPIGGTIIESDNSSESRVLLTEFSFGSPRRIRTTLIDPQKKTTHKLPRVMWQPVCTKNICFWWEYDLPNTRAGMITVYKLAIKDFFTKSPPVQLGRMSMGPVIGQHPRLSIATETLFLLSPTGWWQSPLGEPLQKITVKNPVEPTGHNFTGWQIQESKIHGLMSGQVGGIQQLHRD